jgi:hypothetical protein
MIIIWVPTAIIHMVFVRAYAGLPYFVPPKEKKRDRWEDEEAEDRRDEDRRDEDRPRERRRPPRRREEDEEGE